MNKLYQGNCLEILKQFEDKSIDYVFTSPPYNIKRSKNNKYNKYEYFDDGIDNYLDWSISIIDELLRVTKNHIFWNIQPNYYNKKDVYKLIGYYADIKLVNHTTSKAEMFSIASGVIESSK